VTDMNDNVNNDNVDNDDDDMKQHDDNDRHSTSEPWEGAMSSEFDRRVRHLHEAPLSLESVKGKAVSIRRRRRAVAAGAVLATAAVITPVALLAGGQGAGTTTPLPINPATTGTQDPGPAAPDLSPSYVEGDVLLLPDGSAYDLPKSTYEAAVDLGGRVIGQVRDDSGNLTVDLVENGEVVRSWTASSGLSVDVDRELAAFVTERGEVQTVWADGERGLAGAFDGWAIRSVSGSSCVDATSDCRVTLTNEAGTGDPVVLAGDGTSSTPLPGAISIDDVAGERYLAVTELDETVPSTCGGVYATDGTELVGTCEHQVKQFSPDGRFATGLPSYVDGFGPRTISILDASTGEELGSVTSSDEESMGNAAWVDADTLAMTRYSFADRTWTLLTLTVGEDEPVVVAGPTKGEEFDPTFGIIGR
jgi:hypothetical protein